LEAASFGVSCLLVCVTLVWPRWIELLFQIDPDHNSGGLEWLIVLAMSAWSFGSLMLARREWRRCAPNVTAAQSLDHRQPGQM
jgi:hypothetical protein